MRLYLLVHPEYQEHLKRKMSIHHHYYIFSPLRPTAPRSPGAPGNPDGPGRPGSPIAPLMPAFNERNYCEKISCIFFSPV